MKVGSIVEYVGNGNFCFYASGKLTEGTPLKRNQPYTIRDILKAEGCICVSLVEVICPIHPILKQELVYMMKDFRELLPPMEIQSALDECEPVLIELK